MVAIMFVCLGNICRSPAAEGIFRHLIEKSKDIGEIRIASSGIGDWHVGQLPDIRMRQAALGRGVVLSTNAQQFKVEDFDGYDYILAADHEVVQDLYRHARLPEDKAKVHLITAFSKSYPNEEIPDPYYGGNRGFELVLDMLEDACEGLLDHIRDHGQE